MVTSVQEAGDALGLTTEHIRLYCDLAGISTATPSAAIGNLSNQLPPEAVEVRKGLLAPRGTPSCVPRNSELIEPGHAK
ncbi:hypothetical protein ACIBJF_36320 [Streptomyces sp. NPDC050743]|uniref:hypothetical protein n=1 Tax=Streptomyces sp. NPDC050743 TaxID=3365634 RepID=UPI00379B1848